MEITNVQVMKSNAGYYLGRAMIDDGMQMPFSRESGYYATEKEAKEALHYASGANVNCSCYDEDRKFYQEHGSCEWCYFIGEEV